MTQIAVIGAGPYGLSIAAHLRDRRVETRIFGVPMLMWREHMPRGMLLKSDGFASNLSAPGNAFPLESFCESKAIPYAPIGMRTKLETIIDYGLEFQRRYVGQVEAAQVQTVSQHGSRFELVTDTGERVLADKVVVASGLMAFRNIPQSLSGLPTEYCSHVSAHADPGCFRGKRVAIIGAGQSALETSALLRESGANVTIVSRRPLFWYDPANEELPVGLWNRIRRPNFGLGPGWRTWFLSEAPGAFRYLPARYRVDKAYTSFGPAGSGWLKHRVDGLIPVQVGQIASARLGQDEVHLSIEGHQGTDIITADHVITATGYVPDVRRLSFLEPLLPRIATLTSATRGGPALPVLDRGFGSSLPGLHFVGALAGATFGPSMRFIYGTRFTCQRLIPAISPQRAASVTGKLVRQPA